MLPYFLNRSAPPTERTGTCTRQGESVWLSQLTTFVSIAAGLLIGLFVTVVIIAGECALSCTAVRALGPAVAFAVSLIGCVVTVVYSFVHRSRAAKLWCHVFAWLSGACAYLVAYGLHFYA